VPHLPYSCRKSAEQALKAVKHTLTLRQQEKPTDVSAHFGKNDAPIVLAV
jgi:hypothetical protein